MERAFEEYKQYINIVEGEFEGCPYLLTTIKKNISQSEIIRPRLKLTCEHNCYSNVTSLYDYMIDKDILFGVNAGIFNTGTNEPECVLVLDGKVLYDRLETYVHVNANDGGEKRDIMYILGIKDNGDLKLYSPTYTAQQIIDDGCTEAFMGFVPLVMDYKVVDWADEAVPFGSYLNKQRQIIGQWENGDYFILTVLESGLTYKQTKALLMKLNVPYGYALDNGSSTQTMFHHERLTPVYRHETGRRIPTILIFNVESAAN